MPSGPFRVKSTLSKGRFVSACECPTKLYYKCHSEEYLDAGVDDEFLMALAQGGFQVRGSHIVCRRENLKSVSASSCWWCRCALSPV